MNKKKASDKKVKKSDYQPRLKVFYREQLRKELMKRLDYSNIYEVPQFKKIIINVGLGEAVNDQKVIELVKTDIARITGQMPTPTRAKRPISNFHIRKGMIIGLKVTLRGNRMYEFFDRFVNVAAPRIRDFRGFSRESFDGRGCYNIGLTEQTIFPEIEYDKIKKVFGMDIAIVTTAKNDDDALTLLENMGMPFTRKK